MSMIRNRFALALVVAALAAPAFAQQGQPRGKAETTVNGKKVVIDYGRPALKGRTLDGLMKDLPEDRIWRAGENQVTTIQTDTALSIGGTKLPAGKYSLYVHAPANGDWSLCINKNLGIPLGEIWDKAPPDMAKEPWPALMGYQKIADQEVGRVKMKKAAGGAGDVFTIGLKADTLTLSWGDMTWTTSIQAGM
jgi:uncharacterized protein (DUF2141 family)